MIRSDEGAGASSPRCPTIGEPVVWTGNPSRPFCSIRCQFNDLGRWLDERVRSPGPPLPDTAFEEPSSREATVGRDRALGSVREV